MSAHRKEIEADTRKLTSFIAFPQAISDEAPSAEAGAGHGAGRTLKSFADQRRKYLLENPEIKTLRQLELRRGLATLNGWSHKCS